MTIPKIVTVRGGTIYDETILMCTGCEEYYFYSWRQWKGDFAGNITDYGQFLQWAKWHAAQHECFLAGRVGYLPPDFFEGVERGVKAAKEGRTTPWEEAEPPSELERHASQPDFDQAERHEDPWGGVGYIEEPDEDDDLDAWMDEELDLPPEEDDEDDWIDLGADDEWYEPDIDEDEFGFYAGPILGTVTGRLRDIVRDPYFLLTLTSPAPVEIEITYIEFDYAELEQRVVDEELLRAGVYSLDNHGCLRDEKGRCLACLRPGPHFPFYYKRTQ